MIKDRQSLANDIVNWKKEGLKVWYTSGVFDLLHAGHLDYLQKSKDYCDILIIGLNTDASVKKNKGPKRPVISEEHRIQLVSGLKPVDGVFLFSELNNNENIKTLKPDVYIKAGDYKVEHLSSAPLVKELGGEVVIIPVNNNISSTSIIDKITASETCHYEEVSPRKKRPAVFLDRDGVINKDVHYLNSPEKFELTENCIEAMTILAKLDCSIVIVTNQAGIGMGYFDHSDFYKVNQAMFRALAPSGIAIDKVYYCPHGVADQCQCRKPKTGLFERALSECNIDKASSFMIGDQVTDIQAGQEFGIKTIHITNKNESPANQIADDILKAIEIVAKDIPAKVEN
jgi:rfaE bifunctional protein nucleotidyltransferase chain/domain